MNTSNVVFRSHLMQQFASAARNQSRPPIALSRTTSSLASSRRQQQGHHSSSLASSRYDTTSDDNHRRFSATAMIEPIPTPHVVVENNEEHDVIANDDDVTAADFHRTAVANETSTINDDETQEEDSTTASSFQSSSCRRFLPSVVNMLRPILDRAILCAQTQNSHHNKRDNVEPPFHFKRLLSQSSIHALADIIKQVVLLKHSNNDNDKAERKRIKWSQMPAYIVTLVEGQPNQEEDEQHTFDSTTAFSPLPFVPPQTERQLEDYASSYAAIQNLLQSLQAEHNIGTKWVTEPVICTRAFRRLVHAKPTDRVVGLVMVLGTNSTSTRTRRRRRQQQGRQRRTTMEELVQDL